ncbi:MAG: hypothetical protein ABII00_12995 [Elusimicrobiota bacterium]
MRERVKCPSCGELNDGEREYCWACYAKLGAEEKKAAPAPGPPAEPKKTLKEQSAPAGSKRLIGRVVLAIALVLMVLPFLRQEVYFSPIDHVNLAFHEGGHIVFGFFPRFLMVAGGTLMQLAIPLACAVHFLRRKSAIGAQLMLWWTGENLLNISIYIDDARRQELPLVAGGVHDWTYLLERTGLLVQNEGVARIVFLAGSALILYSVFLIVRDGWEK